MSLIVNQVSGSETYYDASGNLVTGTTQPNVNSGSATQAGASNPNFENVLFSGVSIDPTVYDNSFYILGVGLNLSNGIPAVVNEQNTGYQNGISAAIRAGYWNIYTGSWSTVPTNNTYDFGVQDTSTFINYLGQMNTESFPT